MLSLASLQKAAAGGKKPLLGFVRPCSPSSDLRSRSKGGFVQKRRFYQKGRKTKKKDVEFLKMERILEKV